MAINLLTLIPLVLQTLGALGQASAARQAADVYQRRVRAEEDIMREYLEEMRQLRPYREAVRQAFLARANQQPFYARVWGRYSVIR